MTLSELRHTAWARWLKLRGLWYDPPIETPASLRDFIATRAALVAQKVAVDYCRGKTGLFSHALFTEKDFQDALTACRWESFAATLADILVMTEGVLRPATSALGGTDIAGRASAENDKPGGGFRARSFVGAACAAGRVGDALARLYPEILASYPVPSHRKEKGWSDAEAAFAIRFAAARAAPPRPPAEVAEHSARRLFETLPIHTNMRKFDEEIVFGAVRFRMVAIQQELQRRARPAELIAAFAAGRAGAQSP